MARWKAWPCRFGMPGSTTPESRSAPAASAPASTASRSPRASISSRTPSANPSGNSAVSAKSAVMRNLASRRGWTRYPDAMAPHGHDRSAQLRSGVISEDLRHQGDPHLRRDIRQSDQASVRRASVWSSVPKSVSIVTRIRPSSAAQRSRARSPGSGPSVLDSRTSWPWSRSHAARRRPAHRSIRNLTVSRRARPRSGRGRSPLGRTRDRLGCRHARGRDSRPESPRSVSPCASRLRTSSTEIRIPLTTGLPPKISGSVVMRVKR